MDAVTERALTDELEKIAWNPLTLMKGLPEMTKRIVNPVYGIKKGIRLMSPRARLLDMKSVDRAAALKNTFKSAHLGQHLDKPLKLGATLSGKHGKRGKAFAEELSRRGWTGQGKLTKYIPVGEKGMQTGFAAMAVPTVMNASMKGGKYGEGGKFEVGLGEIAGVGATVASGGMGLIPAIAMGSIVGGAARKVGRTVDRYRKGAGVKDAWSASTPTQAAKNLQNMRRYHPGTK